MPALCSGRRQLITALVVTALSAGWPALPAAGAGDVPVVVERLPDTSLFCSLVGRENRLLESLEGKPAVLFVTDVDHGGDNPLGYLLASLQEQYYYWFTWAGMLVGEVDPEKVRQVHAASPFHLERCFGDRGGEVRDSLGLSSLPAIVLVNEDGYIIDRIVSADPVKGREVAGVLDRLARAANMKGKPVRDFNLPEVKTGAMRTLLDVALREYTMIVFLNTGSPICFRQLGVLQHVRDQNSGRAGLVAIFQDRAPREEIQVRLDRHGGSPDFVLHDPLMGQAKSYSFRYVPVLLVLGPDGRIAFARKGYQQEKSWHLANELEELFRGGGGRGEENPFQAARRIHAESLQYLKEGNVEMGLMFFERILELRPELTSVHAQAANACWDLGRFQDAARHYGRYLAAHPQAYDRDQIMGRLRSMTERSP